MKAYENPQKQQKLPLTQPSPMASYQIQLQQRIRQLTTQIQQLQQPLQLNHSLCQPTLQK